MCKCTSIKKKYYKDTQFVLFGFFSPKNTSDNTWIGQKKNAKMDAKKKKKKVTK